MEILQIIKEIQKLKKNSNLNKEAIKEMQNQKFYKLVKHALHHSEFYKDLYEKNGITLENFESIPISSYPTVNKEIIQDNFDLVVTDNRIKKKELLEFLNNEKNWNKKYLGLYKVLQIPSQKDALYLYDQKAWIASKAFILARGDNKDFFSLLKEQKTAFIGLTKGAFGGVSLAREMEKNSYKMLILDIEDSPSKNLEYLEKFKPKIISGFASGLVDLAREYLQSNSKLETKLILSTADTLSPLRLSLIEKAFGSRIIDYYSANEALGIGLKNFEESTFTAFDDYYKLEILSDDFNEVRIDEVGKLVITNFSNYILPLIRYELNDYLQKKSKVTSPFTKFNIIGGKSEVLKFEDNSLHKVVIPKSEFSSIFHKGLKKIQFLQLSQHSLEVNYTSDTTLGSFLEKEIYKILHKYKLYSLNIHIKKSKEINLERKYGRLVIVRDYFNK